MKSGFALTPIKRSELQIGLTLIGGIKRFHVSTNSTSNEPFNFAQDRHSAGFVALLTPPLSLLIVLMVSLSAGLSSVPRAFGPSKPLAAQVENPNHHTQKAIETFNYANRAIARKVSVKGKGTQPVKKSVVHKSKHAVPAAQSQPVASSHKIVIILPTGDTGTPAANVQVAQQTAQLLKKMLGEIGASTDTLEDRAISSSMLKRHQLAILPLNPNITPKVAAALRDFVEGGGKLFVTYILADSVAELLHLRRTGWVPQERLGQFASIQLDAPDIVGLPQSVKQASWNITLAEPTDSRTRVIGYWYDDTDKPTGYPALTLGDNGAFFSHTVLPDDWASKVQLFTSLFGHLAPDIWRDIAKRSLAGLTSVGHLKNWNEITEFFTHQGGEPLKTLKDAQKLTQDAQTYYAQGAFVKAFDAANDAHKALSEVYLLAHPSPEREGRAVWNSSGTGAYPGNWDRSARELAAAGFNMIFPNMLRGGVAHYPSDFLPRSQTFTQYGDQIAQCVEAAHRYGLEVHVWKVNWNLSAAPKEFVEKMRQEGRTQVSRTGEPINWLCPSHPDNLQLELNSLLEVVRKYDIDGIHFDYIRYPEQDGCYCDGCRTRFTLATGNKIKNWPADVLNPGPLRGAYLEWRVEQITRLVRLVHERARPLRPGLKISAAVFGGYPACVQDVGQDWVAWAKAGYVDFLCPMDYTEDDQNFTRLVKRQLELTDKRIPLYPGIGVTASNSVLTPDRVLGQVYLARDAGASGFTLFDYTSSIAGSVIPAFSMSAGATKAEPVHKGK